MNLADLERRRIELHAEGRALGLHDEPAASVFQRAIAFAISGTPQAAALAAETAGDPAAAALLRAAVDPHSTTGSAGALTTEIFGPFIDALRPQSALLGIAGALDIEFGRASSITMPRLSSLDAPAGGFVAEGGAIRVSSGTLDTVVMTPRKVGGLLVGSRELFERAKLLPAVERALARNLARAADVVFLGAGAEDDVQPAGLFHTTNAATAIASVGAAADVAAIVAAMTALGVDITRCTWIPHPAVWNALATLAVGGVPVFPEVRAYNKLMGAPIIVSPDADPTRLALIYGAELRRALEPYGVEVTDDGAVLMDDAPADNNIGGTATPVRSLWQTDSKCARVLAMTTWRVVSPEAVQHVDGILWA